MENIPCWNFDDSKKTKKNYVSYGKYFINMAEFSNLLGTKVDNLINIFQKDSLLKKSNHTLIPPKDVRNLLLEKGLDYSFKVISNINLRGGIGKTTCSLSLASRAHQYGFRTCLIDLDSQGSASMALNVELNENDQVFCDLLDDPENNLFSAIKRIDQQLYLLPSSLENGSLDLLLSSPKHQKQAVCNICNILKKHHFDLVVIDCPPSLNAAIVSSICASDIIIIPLGNDLFSLKGLTLTIDEILSIVDTFGLRPPQKKILFSRFDGREKLSSKRLRKLHSLYPQELIPYFIRNSSEFNRALEKRETIFANHKSTISKQDYDAVVKYLLNLSFDSKEESDKDK